MGRADLRHLHHVRPLHRGLPDGHRHRLASSVRRRKAFVAAGLGPADLLQAAENSRDHGSPLGLTPEKLVDRLEWLADDHEIEMVLDKAKADVLLTVSSIETMKYPHSLSAMAKILTHAGVDWTFSTTGLRGHQLRLSRRRARYRQDHDPAHRRGRRGDGREDRGHPRMRPCLRRDALGRRPISLAARCRSRCCTSPNTWPS